jgi:hypothetical protein
MRKNQFTVDAESVQGNPGASVTFRKITVGERRRYIDDDDYNDPEIVGDHILDWSGITDDEGNEIPSPKDEPGITATLYLDEMRALALLFWRGPDGPNTKN